MKEHKRRRPRLERKPKPELIRCYQCRHFKPIGSGHVGWCQDAKPKIRVNAVDFCDSAEKEEAEG